MPVYYYPSGQYPTSTTQQYRPIASVQYNAQRSQQIPQTAQQAGIYVCYSRPQLLKAPWLVKPRGWAFLSNVNSGGESWSLFCLKTRCCLEMPSSGRADVAPSATAVLHAVPRPRCLRPPWRGTEGAGREPV